MGDVAGALARCAGADEGVRVCSELDETHHDALVNVDQRLIESWRETVDEFCAVPRTRRTRERGVHTNCEFLVAEFITSNLGIGDTAKAKL